MDPGWRRTRTAASVAMISRENGMSDVVMRFVRLSTTPTLWPSTGPSIAGLGSGEKIFFGAPSKGKPAENLHTKWERLLLTYRVTWVWSEGVNLYSLHIMILQRQTKTYATHLGPRRPIPDSLAPVICTVFPSNSLALAVSTLKHQYTYILPF